MPRSVSRRALNEALHCATAGFRPWPANSSASNVRANQPRSSPSRSSSMTHTPGRAVRVNLIRRSCSREQRQLRSPRREPPAPLANEAQLLDDLVLQVPRQDQHDVGLLLAYRLGRADGDVAARQEVPLLVRVQIAGVVDEVATYAAVVEQRVALGRGAVAGYAQAVLLEGDQEAEDLALVRLHTAAVAEVGLELLIARRPLALAQLACRVGFGLAGIVRVASIDAQRASVRGQLLDVEQPQAVRLEDASGGEEG